MAKSRNQKGKILVIEHLLQGTGESRIVTMQEILDKLLEYGITAERKSIYDDKKLFENLDWMFSTKEADQVDIIWPGDRKLLRHRSQFTQKRKQGFQKMQRQKKNQNQ